MKRKYSIRTKICFKLFPMKITVVGAPELKRVVFRRYMNVCMSVTSTSVYITVPTLEKCIGPTNYVFSVNIFA